VVPSSWNSFCRYRSETWWAAAIQPLAEIAAGSAHDIDVAVTSARRALDGAWGATPGPARALVLNRIAGLIERDGEILARLEALDVGKPVGQGLGRDRPGPALGRHEGQRYRPRARLERHPGRHRGKGGHDRALTQPER
jgi:acyl-CoA reductase-like NAD-dependent aldehyde dehydrogenase